MSVSPLDALAAQARACRVCRDAPAGRPLPHEPRPVFAVSATARILVAGQAPGTKVHASGIPFDDRSGDRLREWMGVDRATFHDAARIAILPMGFCFPGQDARGGDLPPRRECAPLWRARLLALMPRIELVLVLGTRARAWHLPAAAGEPLGVTLGRWREIFAPANLPRTLPLPHPSWRNTAWLKRNPWFERDLLPVLKQEVAARIALPIEENAK